MAAVLQNFARDESGLTAIECVAIMAVLFPLTFALAEIQRYNRYGRHLWAAADSFVTLLSTRDGALSGSILSDDSRAIADAVPEAAAALGGGWREGLGVQATLVRFAPVPPDCVDACAFPRGAVVWTWSGGSAGSRALLRAAGVLRACGALAPTASSQPAAAFLAQDAFGPDLRLVVDLVYPFRPMLVSNVLGPRNMVWQAHRPAREAFLDVSALTDGIAACP